MFNKEIENGPTIWAISVDGRATEILVGEQFKLELSALDSINDFAVSAVFCSLIGSAILGSIHVSQNQEFRILTCRYPDSCQFNYPTSHVSDNGFYLLNWIGIWNHNCRFC